MIRHLITAAAGRRRARGNFDALDRLDDRQLDDIGLSRDDVERMRPGGRYPR